jgi:hypothetical protein
MEEELKKAIFGPYSNGARPDGISFIFTRHYGT